MFSSNFLSFEIETVILMNVLAHFKCTELNFGGGCIEDRPKLTVFRLN